jgi:hypothetical protein
MRNSFLSTVALVAAVTIAGPTFDQGLLRAGSPARSSASAAAAQSKKRVTVPAGTRILIRTIGGESRSKFAGGRCGCGAPGYQSLWPFGRGIIRRTDVGKF